MTDHPRSFGDLRPFLEEAIRLAELHDEANLRYACLQLRMCIETIFYRLIPLYRESLPDSVLRDWRPREIMDAIIASDPMSQWDHVTTITPHTGERVPIVSEQPGLSKKLLRAFYHSLGSRLHAQLPGKLFDPVGTYRLILDAAAAMQRDAETVFQMGILLGVRLRCVFCGRRFRRSVFSIGQDPLVVCPNDTCGARYDAQIILGGARLTVRQMEIECPECRLVMPVSEHLVVDGYQFRCIFCREPWTLSQALALVSRRKDPRASALTTAARRALHRAAKKEEQK